MKHRSRSIRVKIVSKRHKSNMKKVKKQHISKKKLAKLVKSELSKNV